MFKPFPLPLYYNKMNNINNNNNDLKAAFSSVSSWKSSVIAKPVSSFLLTPRLVEVNVALAHSPPATNPSEDQQQWSSSQEKNWSIIQNKEDIQPF